MSENLDISTEDLSFIRSLADFDLIMLISEVHDHGWEMAEKTLGMMKEAAKVDPSIVRS